MTPDMLTVGLRLMLPSGNVLRLLHLEGSEWTCEYTAIARARGQVVYTVAFLCRYGAVV